MQRLFAAALPSFYAEAAHRLPNGLPTFVQSDLERFVACGDFGRGFVHLRCEGCEVDRYVAFTCKSRGCCPSCGGMRMTQLGAHLIDAVIPYVPVRQFVLTVPFELRAKLAFDSEFAAEVKRALHTSMQAAYRRRAKARGFTSGRAGGVTAVQRFGSGLNLHVHFHALMLDGVFTGSDEGSLRFHDSLPWNAQDVSELLVDVVGRLLHRGVVDFDADVRDEMDKLAENEPLGIASSMHRIALGPRRGQRVERIGAQKALRGADLVIDPRRPKARYAGFDLEASVRIGADDRKGLERLCRYLLRPPIAEKRLRFREDGKIEVGLKSGWPDGTTHLAFTPIELLEKAAALIPRPHENLLIYHGVLAGNAKGRAAIVDYHRPVDASRRVVTRQHGEPKKRSRSPRDWATMMRRGLGIEVLVCPKCGGRLRIRALLDGEAVAHPFATKLGLARTRAGPEELVVSTGFDTHYEPDPEFADPYDA